MPEARTKRNSILRSLGSLLPRRKSASASGDRVIEPWREDSLVNHPSVGLTPAKARQLLHAADAGAPKLQYELFNEMLQKWPRLSAVEATRRLALTGLEWEVANATRRHRNAQRDGVVRDEVISFCDDALANLPRWNETLDFLATAIGYGIAVAELVWEGTALVDVVPVPYSRLIADRNEPWRLRVLTEEFPTEGVALDEQPNKWVIHQPRVTPGRPFTGGLLRASMLLYVAQNLSLKDWLIFSQVAGMPIRVAQFESGVSDEDKRKLLRMLESLGTDAVAAFSKNIDLKIVESNRNGGQVYQQIQDYCNTEVTILWLGQHLTTDIRNSGSRAAAEIHDRVREDLLVDDIADESETIRRDILTPLVRTRFGADAAVPTFRRSLVQAIDTRSLAETLAVAVNEVGMSVPKKWAHSALGIPEAAQGEPVLARGDLS